uniref:Uncharacterized protein n=1 Tax=Sinocyclocheilus rhinocerous TaxID=307959 RepID=A0A673MQW5_9TELE
MDDLRQQRNYSGGSSGDRGITETTISTTRITSLPPRGFSASANKGMSSTSGSSGLEKNILTQNNSSPFFSSSSVGVSAGGFGSRSGEYLVEETTVSRKTGGASGVFESVSGSGTGSRVRSSSTDGMRRTQDSPLFVERKSKTTHSRRYDGSSSDSSSPEIKRKDYGSTRGRSQSRETEIRTRLQSASPSTRWTELDDVKKLLKGSRSASVSPTRSPSSSPLPIPRKASTLDTKISTKQVEQYDTTILDADLASYTWNSSTLPSTVSTGTAYGFNSNTNNMSTGATLVNSTSPSSLSGYGVQKNYLTSPSSTLGVGTGISTTGVCYIFSVHHSSTTNPM